MVGTLAIGGGALYGGYKLYQQLAKERPSLWLWKKRVTTPVYRHEAQPAQSKMLMNEQPSVDNALGSRRAMAQLDRYGLTTALLSLGTSTLGALCFTPLHYASVPLLVYLGIRPAQAAYQALHDDGQPTVALAETMALAVCLAGGYYVAGSLGFSLYYLGRIALHHQQITQIKEGWFLPRRVRLQKEGEELWTPLNRVQPGDLVIIRHSEMVALTGVIRQGSALIKACRCPDQAEETIKRVGDRVSVADIVQAGALVIQVQALPLTCDA